MNPLDRLWNLLHTRTRCRDSQLEFINSLVGTFQRIAWWTGQFADKPVDSRPILRLSSWERRPTNGVSVRGLTFQTSETEVTKQKSALDVVRNFVDFLHCRNWSILFAIVCNRCDCRTAIGKLHCDYDRHDYNAIMQVNVIESEYNEVNIGSEYCKVNIGSGYLKLRQLQVALLCVPAAHTDVQSLQCAFPSY